MTEQATSTNEPLALDLGLPTHVGDHRANPQLLEPGERVVRVLIDEPAIDREFDYIVPAKWADDVRVGSIVRVDLRKRRVRGWVSELDVEPVLGVHLSGIKKVSGLGPPPGIIALARWAAHRWVGRTAHFLRTASPPRMVATVARREARVGAPAENDPLVVGAFEHAIAVVRLPPTSDVIPFARAAAARGRALILAPSATEAHYVAVSLRRAGIPTALMPNDWDRSAGGAVSVGTRAAAFSPLGPLDAVVVIDEHDEAYQEEAAPTWHARSVAIERARRDGAPCVLLSPSPSLEALAQGTLMTPSRHDERAGWPVVEVIDRRGDDPATGEWCSPALSRMLASGRSVACVINRKGRARFPICNQCGEVPRSDVGEVLMLDGDGLVDRRTGAERPVVCAKCGSTRFRKVRLGVSGVRDELEAMARRPVAEITKDDPAPPSDVDLYVGTEAMLHRLDHVDVVAFLDMDQELLAPRFMAGEQAMALIVRAARLVGPRSAGGRVLIQTRIANHEVLDAALHADPGRLAVAETERRRQLHLPPFTALAVVSGQAAAGFIGGVDTSLVTILGPDDGRWLVSAVDHEVLSDALIATPRPPGRLRIEIDPARA